MVTWEAVQKKTSWRAGEAPEGEAREELLRKAGHRCGAPEPTELPARACALLQGREVGALVEGQLRAAGEISGGGRLP